MKHTATTANGFSLLELIIVATLISILAAYTVFRWTGNISKLNSQSQRLANDLRYTQTLATTLGQRHRINFTAPNTYQVLDSAGAATSIAGQIVTLASGISFGTLTSIATGLAFDTQGVPYNFTTPSTYTALTGTATIPLVAGTDTCNIQITQQTGRITITCP